MQFKNFSATIGARMPPRFLTAFLVVLIFVLFVVNASAEYWHLYFFVWWLDIPMHILGGLWVALFGLVAYYSSSRAKKKEQSAIFVYFVAVMLALSVGLAWEIFEFGVGHAVGGSGAGLADMLKDLTDDLIGALLAGLIFLRFGYNENNLSR